MDNSNASHELWTALLAELKCPICKDVLREPYSTPCGHTFCHECIRRHLETRQSCPCCAAYVTVDLVHQVFSLLKVLEVGQSLAPQGHDFQVPNLIKFLSRTPLIDTSEQVDQLMTVLQRRRDTLHRQRHSVELQLLRLFLEQAKASVMQRLTSAQRTLQCVHADKAANQRQASADTMRASADAAASRSEASGSSAATGTAAQPDPRQPQTRRTQSTTPTPPMAMHAERAQQTDKPVLPDAALQSKQAFVEAHLDDLEEHYLRLCDRASSTQEGAAAAPAATYVLPSTSEPSTKAGHGARGAAPPVNGKREAASRSSKGGEQPRSIMPSTQTSATDDTERLTAMRSVLSETTQFTGLQDIAEMLPRAPGPQNAVSGIAFACDGRVFATAGMPSSIKLYNFDSVVAEGTRLHQPLAELTGQNRVCCLDFSTTDAQKLVCSGAPDGVVRLWDASVQRATAAFAGHRKRVWSLDYCPTRPKMFVSGSDDATVRFWSEEQSSHAMLVELGTNVCCVANNRWDSNLFAAGTAGHWMAVYDVRHTQAPLAHIPGLTKAVSYVQFVSRFEVVAACVNSSLSVWNIDDLACERVFNGHVNERNFVGMSVNGNYIACGSETSQVHVYNKHLTAPMLTHTLQPRLAPPANNYFTMAATWKPQSSNLLVSASTGSVHVLAMRSEGQSGS